MIDFNEPRVKRVEELVLEMRAGSLNRLSHKFWVYRNDGTEDYSTYNFTREELDVLIAHFRVQGIGSEWALKLLKGKD